MGSRQWIGRVVLTGVLVVSVTVPPSLAQAPAESRWGRQAEDAFRLGPGIGPQLMTEQEWQQHRQKMQALSAEEWERYRAEWHQRMVERARERGLNLPETPGPRPGGPGMGTGPGDEEWDGLGWQHGWGWPVLIRCPKAALTLKGARG